MDTLEVLFRPLIALVNRQIKATTPARELCAELDGRVIALRIKDTALAAYFFVCPDEITIMSDYDGEPDVAISGSPFSLVRLAGDEGENAIRDGSLDMVGDMEVAQAFQALLGYGRPDIEEELSAVIGDVAAHRLGQMARGVSRWSEEAAATLRQNITEYLQEERRDVPSRYEVEAFTRKVDALRDDVARAEARLKQLEQKD